MGLDLWSTYPSSSIYVFFFGVNAVCLLCVCVCAREWLKSICKAGHSHQVPEKGLRCVVCRKKIADVDDISETQHQRKRETAFVCVQPR